MFKERLQKLGAQLKEEATRIRKRMKEEFTDSELSDGAANDQPPSN